MACRGRVRSKLDCVKWLEINSMCMHGMWRRVRYKPDCFKWLEINHLCAWYVEEGTVQTWLCQIAGNQCYVCALHVGGGYSPNLIASNALKSILCVHGLWTRVRSKLDCVKWLEINSTCVHGMWRRVRYKPDCFKWLEINHLCAWYVEEGTVQIRLCQMVGNQAYVCSCVHGMWRRVPSKPDCVKWLEIKPICVHSMLHVLCKIKLLLLWHETCNMTPHVFNKKKCYLSLDMFIYSTFAELKLLFIHIFYSVKHLKNIYSSLLFSLLAVNYNIFNVLRTNSELILTMWNNIRSI